MRIIMIDDIDVFLFCNRRFSSGFCLGLRQCSSPDVFFNVVLCAKIKSRFLKKYFCLHLSCFPFEFSDYFCEWKGIKFSMPLLNERYYWNYLLVSYAHIIVSWGFTDKKFNLEFNMVAYSSPLHIDCDFMSRFCRNSTCILHKPK